MDWQIDALTQILGPRTAGMVAKFYTKHPEAPRMMSLSLPRRGSREAVQKILANRELSAPW